MGDNTGLLVVWDEARDAVAEENASIAVWARSHDSCFMSRAAPTKAYRLNGTHATYKCTLDISPDVGLNNCIVGLDRSTSILRPALWPTRDVAPETAAYSPERRQTRS